MSPASRSNPSRTSGSRSGGGSSNGRRRLLLDHFDEGAIDSYILLDEVREAIRIEKIEAIGEDKVPGGPNVVDSDAIIIVEGRADVINLLKYGIKNAVAVEGTNVPETIVDLSDKKTATAFLDGDRGGELILRELLQIADIDFVAFSPRGKSVEDMSRKEIIKALRNKIPVEYVREQYLRRGRRDAARSRRCRPRAVALRRLSSRHRRPSPRRKSRPRSATTWSGSRAARWPGSSRPTSRCSPRCEPTR